MYVCIGVWAAKLLICEVEGFFFFLIFLIFLIMDEEGFGVGNEMAPCKSWAQQTEESYQLQLAMALRLSSQAASADDPHFLALSSCDRHTDSAETVSHRFWVCVFSFSFAFFEFLPLFAWWEPFLFCMLGLFGC